MLQVQSVRCGLRRRWNAHLAEAFSAQRLHELKVAAVLRALALPDAVSCLPLCFQAALGPCLSRLALIRENGAVIEVGELWQQRNQCLPAHSTGPEGTCGLHDAVICRCSVAEVI